MNTLPDDLIVYMALSYDMEDLVSYCRTSKRANHLVCDNNNFWIQKLKRDFGISMDDIKRYYRDRGYDEIIQNMLKNLYLLIDLFYTHLESPQKGLVFGIAENNEEIMEMALFLGADSTVPYENKVPILTSLYNYKNLRSFLFLLKKGAIKSKQIAEGLISQTLDILENLNGGNGPYTFAYWYILFDEILPRSYEYLKGENIWNMMIEHLETIKSRDERYQDIYDRRIEEYKAQLE